MAIPGEGRSDEEGLQKKIADFPLPGRNLLKRKKGKEV